ncbi:MAG: NUDIX hydrolase [Candidatus Paceibacterota bacterium]
MNNVQAIRRCDNTSVGILVFQDEKLLLIDRKKPPFGFAAPAGHVDDHGDPDDPEEKRYEQAALDELQEETGLIANELVPWAEGRMENPCRRPGGSWHHWRIYIATNVTGTLRPSKDETKGHFWCSREQMRYLLRGNPLPIDGREVILEPVWKDWFLEREVLFLFPSRDIAV